MTWSSYFLLQRSVPKLSDHFFLSCSDRKANISKKKISIEKEPEKADIPENNNFNRKEKFFRYFFVNISL
jgi:hypothetical protein